MLCFASSSGVSGAHLVVKWSVHEMLSFVYVIFSSGVSRAHLAVQWSVRVQCWFRTCHIFYECYSSTPRVKVKISWKVVFRTCHIFVGSYYLKIMMMFVLPSTVHLHSYVDYDLLVCRHWELNGGLFFVIGSWMVDCFVVTGSWMVDCFVVTGRWMVYWYVIIKGIMSPGNRLIWDRIKFIVLWFILMIVSLISCDVEACIPVGEKGWLL